jgi:hypothetical protein
MTTAPTALVGREEAPALTAGAFGDDIELEAVGGDDPQTVRDRIAEQPGGVGLCEYVQHLAIFDYIAQRSLEDRVVEYVDHLQEQSVDPAVVRDGRSLAPTAPGYSITIQPASLAGFAYPDGDAWTPLRRSAPAR